MNWEESVLAITMIEVLENLVENVCILRKNRTARLFAALPVAHSLSVYVFIE